MIHVVGLHEARHDIDKTYSTLFRSGNKTKFTMNFIACIIKLNCTYYKN